MTATKTAPAAEKAPKTAKAPKTKDVTPKNATPGVKTARTRGFELLAKKGPLTGKQVMEQLGTANIPSWLKDEGVCDKPRIRRKTQEEARGVVYELTALGKSDLAKGKVDENAAPASGGKSWAEKS